MFWIIFLRLISQISANISHTQNKSTEYQLLNIFQDIIIIMKFILLYLLLIIVPQTLSLEKNQRLQQIIAKSKSSPNRIINFQKSDFNQYIMKYPRPYDVVIFFTMNSSDLGNELYVKYEQMTKLYEMSGEIDSQKNPTFFARIDFTRQEGIIQIFRMFDFDSVPNLVVSKPQMAIVGASELSKYLKQYTWEISYKDSHVTTHKMLEFTNKRTNKDVEFRHTNQIIKLYLQYFIAASLLAVLAYYLLYKVFIHWIFWLVASLIIYTTCVSGIVYCLIHDIPLIGQANAYTSIFTDGRRQQSSLEGWFVSIMITLIGLMFMFIAIAGEKCSKGYSSLMGVIGLGIIYIGVTYLQKVYKTKGWYGPSFYPPENYLKGPLNIDQGNNI